MSKEWNIKIANFSCPLYQLCKCTDKYNLSDDKRCTEDACPKLLSENNQYTSCPFILNGDEFFCHKTGNTWKAGYWNPDDRDPNYTIKVEGYKKSDVLKYVLELINIEHYTLEDEVKIAEKYKNKAWL